MDRRKFLQITGTVAIGTILPKTADVSTEQVSPKKEVTIEDTGGYKVPADLMDSIAKFKGVVWGKPRLIFPDGSIVRDTGYITSQEPILRDGI